MLKCVSKYASSAGAFVPGDIIEDPKLEAVLIADSPASFVDVESRAQAEDDVDAEPRSRIRGLRQKA